MTTNIHMEGLYLEDFNNSEEQIVEIYTSLMPIIHGTINVEADNEQNTAKKNEKKKNQNTKLC